MRWVPRPDPGRFKEVDDPGRLMEVDEAEKPLPFRVDVHYILCQLNVEIEYLSCLHWRICQRSPTLDWRSRRGR